MDDPIKIYFFLCHFISCCLFYLLIQKKNKFQIFSETMIALLIPLFGLFFVCFMKIVDRVAVGRREEQDIYHQFSKKHLGLGNWMQQQSDIIPLNDALLIEGAEEKRKLLTDAIKQNVLQNQQILLRAIGDHDREVSHYAVSMVTNTIETLESALTDLDKQLQEEPDSLIILEQYAAKMKDYLNLHFLDPISQEKNQKIYAATLEKMLVGGHKEKEVFIEKIECELELKQYAQAEVCCEQFLAAFPLDEKPYLLYMKLYMYLRDYEKLQHKIIALKACPIQLTLEALELIRFWDQGEQYA